MERSTAKEEERTVISYVHHPCYFLQQVLRALFRCLGIVSETNMASNAKEEETTLTLPSGASSIVTTEEDPPRSSQKSYQEAADPPCTTTQTLNTSAMARGGSRRSGISHGSPSQHN